MNFNTQTMVNNEIRKLGLLITEASRLGMELTGYGEADVNANTGNVYIWSDDYPFSLYIGLNDDKVFALHSHYETGDETEKLVSLEDNVHTLYDWAKDLEND
jgi:hypothetical protein